MVVKPLFPQPKVRGRHEASTNTLMPAIITGVRKAITHETKTHRNLWPVARCNLGAKQENSVPCQVHRHLSPCFVIDFQQARTVRGQAGDRQTPLTIRCISNALQQRFPGKDVHDAVRSGSQSDGREERLPTGAIWLSAQVRMTAPNSRNSAAREEFLRQQSPI